MQSAAAVEKTLRSFHEIDNIVGAMKAYAGVAFRKADKAVKNIRTCEERVLSALGDLVAHHPQLKPQDVGDGKRILVAFGSSLGLCGMFNEKVLEAVSGVRAGDDTLLVVGRRLHQLAEARRIPCRGHLEAPASVDGINRALQECAACVTDLYAHEEYYTLSLVFTEVAERGATVAVEQVLPADPERVCGAVRRGEAPLMYEDAETVFAGMLQELLSISLFRCYLESLRSENWYRLRTMEGASESLKRQMFELRSQYNYLRQEEITEEMLEILGGGMFFR